MATPTYNIFRLNLNPYRYSRNSRTSFQNPMKPNITAYVKLKVVECRGKGKRGHN